MKYTSMLAEIVAIGIISNLGIALGILGINDNISVSHILGFLKHAAGISFVIFIAFAYFTGNAINILSRVIFSKYARRKREKVLGELPYSEIRLAAYKLSGDLKAHLDISYSIIRLFRCLVISFVILDIGILIWNPKGLSLLAYVVILVLPLLASLVSFLCFVHQAESYYSTLRNIYKLFNNTILNA